MTRLYKYQKAGVRMLKRLRLWAILADDMGLGKAQPTDAKILTPSGWRRMGDLTVGDRVIGADGKPTRVTGVFPQGVKKVYGLHLSDRSYVECCDDHLWAVHTPCRKLRGSPPRILTTKKIREDLKDAAGNRKHYLPMAAAVQFDRRGSLPIDPYLLGYLISNGGLTANTPIVSSRDNDVLERVQKVLPEGVKLRYKGGVDYTLPAGAVRGKPNPLTAAIRQLGLKGRLSHRKFIPESYLFASITDRTKLLQGLMDGDGYCNKTSTTQYSSSSKRLIRQVKFLVQSLGGVAKEGKESRIPRYTYNGEVREGKPAYHLTIALPNNVTPFYCKRKAKRYWPRVKYQPSRGIDEVRYVGDKECVCISVEAKDGLYLTNHCVVTHNTIQVLTAIKKHLKKKGPILVICPATAKFTWEEQASEHAGMRVVLLNGRRPSRSVVRDMMRREHVMYVLSYNVLTAWRPYLEQMRPVLIVPDECQRLKSPFTKWTQAAMRLKAPHKIFTGGTGGIEKTPQDLWPILVMLRRADWPAWMRRLTRPTESAYNRFVHKFTVVRDTPWGKRPVEPRNMKKLHRFLKRYLLIRRRTKDVLKDLPPVQRMKVSMDLTSRRKYAEAENAAVLQMQMLMRDFKPAGQKDVKMKAIANGLLKKTSKLKLPAMKEWIDGFLEQTDEKLLCFGWNKFVVKGLQRKYGDAISVRVDGSVTGHKRRAALDRFNNDPTCRLAFMNIKSGGEAWSCRSAWNVAFLQVFPNPAAHNQAERRIRGVKRGVEGRPSRYHYLIAKDTAEERLLRKLRREQKTIDQAIDGGRTGGGIDLFEVVTGGRR